jgi:hypothetical protein
VADSDKALTYYLKQDSTLEGYIAGRIYPIALPESVSLPAIVYQQISTTAAQAHGTASELPRHRYQLTAWAGTFGGAVQVAARMKALLDGYRGTWGTTPYEMDIEHCLFADQRDFKDPETGLFQRQQDYFVQYKE